MSKLLRAKIPKLKKYVEIDLSDPIYQDRPDKILEDRETGHIPYLETVKHFPYYNDDKTIRVCEQFGKLLSLNYQDPKTIDRGDVQYWPDLEHVVRMHVDGSYINPKTKEREYNNYYLDVAICNTEELADEIEEKILELQFIEDITKDRRLFSKTIKKQAKKVVSS